MCLMMVESKLEVDDVCTGVCDVRVGNLDIGRISLVGDRQDNTKGAYVSPSLKLLK